MVLLLPPSDAALQTALLGEAQSAPLVSSPWGETPALTDLAIHLRTMLACEKVPTLGP